MSDLIERQAAIDAIEQMQIPIMRSEFPEEQFVFTGMSEALQAIKELPSAQHKQHYDEWCTDCKEYDQEHHCCPRWNRVIKTTLADVQSEQQWIPCSERLPEVYEAGNSVSGMFMQSRPVLVYGVPEYESEHGFHIVTYCDDLNGITYWSTELDAVTINEVIAWMPLPEPYREEGEE